MPNYQGVWSLTVQMQNVSDWPTFVFTNSRALFAGGESSSGTFSDVIDYIDITSTGNATDFGDLSSVKKRLHLFPQLQGRCLEGAAQLMEVVILMFWSMLQ